MNESTFLFFLLVVLSSYDVQIGADFYTVNSFSIGNKLRPYDWQYTRVELPPWFSSTSLQLGPVVDLDTKRIKSGHMIKLPVICFRIGAPPLPDVSNVPFGEMELDHFANASTGSIEILQTTEQCYILRKRISIQLTNEQISPGVLFIGLFNGIGPTRTQAKMINRGSSYSCTTNAIVKGCMYQSMRGQYCNRTVEQILCRQSLLYDPGQSLESINGDNDFDSITVMCNKFFKDSCHQDLGPKIYSLDVVQPAEQLVISASNFTLNRAHFVKKDELSLMCYARNGAIPSEKSYDYSVDLSRAPLVIPFPKVGIWYFSIQPVNKSIVLDGRLQKFIDLCHTMEWDILQCPQGKAGPDCTSNKYRLQLVQSDDSDAFFFYKPKQLEMPVELRNLPLGSLLSNASSGKESDFQWTYFVFDITQDSSGKNLHIDLTSSKNINFELYARFGGIPSVKDWDYCYINQTSNSDNGSLFKLYDSSERRINAYLPYPREGLWSFGLRHRTLSGNHRPLTIISLSVENCPNQCSGHGTCRFYEDKHGLKYYRNYFCKCGARYGGFDCNVQLVSQTAQRWHVIFLTASNAAAILPAVWALRQKAFAEWVVFICSGVASTVYHACDTESWCALSFQVLQFVLVSVFVSTYKKLGAILIQFMDFWLSFMAVVSTFIYLAVINEAARRTLHTIASIITALLAVNGPTMSRNIVLVLALGAVGLIVGWLIEFFSRYKSNSLSLQSRWNTRNIRSYFPDLLKTFYKRFRWGFLLAGFVALSMAALSWNLESIQTYWFWHSAWHVSVYTSAFFFLCSRAATRDYHNLAVEDATSSSPSD